VIVVARYAKAPIAVTIYAKNSHGLVREEAGPGRWHLTRRNSHEVHL
jgi:hypothetical protein